MDCNYKRGEQSFATQATFTFNSFVEEPYAPIFPEIRPLIDDFDDHIEECISISRSLWTGSQGERSESQPEISQDQQNSTSPSKVSESIVRSGSQRKNLKNSNVIKKLGRYILNNIDQFEGGSLNLGIRRMQILLNKRSKVKKGKPQNKRDKCNCQIFKSAFNTEDSTTNSSNLRTLCRLLNKQMRKDVLLKSWQIQGSKNLVYLNTLKISSLRCRSNKLINRLQQSQKK